MNERELSNYPVGAKLRVVTWDELLTRRPLTVLAESTVIE